MFQERLKINKNLLKGYEAFIQSRDRLFVPVEEAAWNPELEVPIRKNELSNGISVYFYLREDPELGISFTIEYPVGRHEDTASHLLEHMSLYPKGIDRVEEKSREAGLSTNAQTGINNTLFKLAIDKHALLTAHQRYDKVFEDISSFLLGMTLFSDISNKNIKTEKERMASENAARRDDHETRMGDYVLPLISLGRNFCHPTFSEETSFDTNELIERHSIRPHQGIKIWVGGNPRIERGQQDIYESLEKTFSQIKGNKKNPFPTKETPKMLFPFGKEVSVISSHPIKDHTVGLVIISNINKTPQEIVADGFFSRLLCKTTYNSAGNEGLVYSSKFFSLDYLSSKANLTFSGATTPQPEKTQSIFKKVANDVFDNKASLDLGNKFKLDKINTLYNIFSEPGFDRIYACELLGLPIEENGKALYDLIKSIELDEVVKAGQKMIEEERLAFVYYGTTQVIPGFTEVHEEELEKIWLS